MAKTYIVPCTVKYVQLHTVRIKCRNVCVCVRARVRTCLCPYYKMMHSVCSLYLHVLRRFGYVTVVTITAVSTCVSKLVCSLLSSYIPHYSVLCLVEVMWNLNIRWHNKYSSVVLVTVWASSTVAMTHSSRLASLYSSHPINVHSFIYAAVLVFELNWKVILVTFMSTGM